MACALDFNMMCCLIQIYSSRYATATVFLVTSKIPRALPCVEQDLSYIVLDDLNSVLDTIASGFLYKKKFVVAVLDAGWVELESRSLDLGAYSEKLGLSRWLIEDDSFRRSSKSSMAAKLPDFFLCLLLGIRAQTVHVPAFFTRCTQRRLIFIANLETVETFDDDELKIPCYNSTCSTKSESLREKYFETFKKFLNVSTLTFIDVDTKDPDLGKNLIKMVAIRHAHVSLVPSVLTYERFSKVTQSSTMTLVEYRVISRRRYGKIIGLTGFVNLFDKGCWFATLVYALVQIVVCALLTRQFLEAGTVVVAVLLWQPMRDREERSWNLNKLFLAVASFILGSIFRNKLTSSLNVELPLLIQGSLDLQNAFNEEAIKAACVSKFEYFANRINRSSTNDILRILGDADMAGKISRAASARDCVEFTASDIKNAAVIYTPENHIHTQFENTNIYISRDAVYTILIAFIHAPWLQFEEKLAKLFFYLSESCLDYPYENGKGNMKPPVKSAKRPKPFSLQNVAGAFHLLFLGLSIGIAAEVSEYMRVFSRRISFRMCTWRYNS